MDGLEELLGGKLFEGDVETEFFLLDHLTVDGLVGEDRDDDEGYSAAKDCGDGADTAVDDGGFALGKQGVVVG